MLSKKSIWTMLIQKKFFLGIQNVFNLGKIRKSFVVLNFFFIFVLSASSQTDPVVSFFWDLFNNNQIDEASNYIENVIVNYPDNYTYYFLRANVNLKKNNTDLVLSDIEKYLTVYPPSTDVFLLKGEALIEMSDYERAILSLYKALDLAQIDVEKQYCFLKMGVVYVRQNNYKMGYDKLLLAQDIFSLNNEYLRNLGVAQLNMGFLDDAEKTKNLLMEMYPNEAETYAFLTEYHQKAGNYKGALHFLEQRLNLEPGSALDYELLKKLAIINNDTLLLIRAYEQELNGASNEYESNVSLANLYSSLKDYNKALIYINKAISINENDPAIYITKGDIYIKSNLKGQGCDCYFQGLKKGYDPLDGKELLQTYIRNCEN